MSKQEDKPSTKGWDTYWQGIRGATQQTTGGFSHPGFPQFWATALGEFAAAKSGVDAKYLDIGTGTGAVIEALVKLPRMKPANISCVDISAAAIDTVRSRFPNINTVVADANDIPLESEQYDLITSQFGIEYAGLSAVGEAIRLLAPGGSLLFLLHIKSGSLYAECTATVDALSRTQNCDFISLTRTFLEAGFDAVRGADRAPYEAAAGAMNPAIQELEAILTEHGEHVANDTIIHLHSTVQTIHAAIQQYEPDEVLGWLDSMSKELPKHRERMESMLESALDEAALKQLCEDIAGQGLTIDRAQASFVEDEEIPIAWVLQATR